MESTEAFATSDRNATVNYQNDLLCRGPLGQLAFGLFRAQKRSERAKQYRRGAHRGRSYAAKNESLKYVDAVLSSLDQPITVLWGWQTDTKQEYHNKVLYVEFEKLGQCSFHSDRTFSDKAFEGKWNQKQTSCDTILKLCDFVMTEFQPRAMTAIDIMPFGKNVGTPLGALDDGYREWLRKWKGITAWAAIHRYITGEYSLG